MALCDVTSNSVHNLKFNDKSTDRYGLTQFNWELYERTLGCKYVCWRTWRRSGLKKKLFQDDTLGTDIY